MLTKAQEEFRQSGIGGSDIATLWKINPYAQPIDLFYAKRPDLIEPHGFEPREVEGFAIDRGNAFEDPIATLVEKRTGRKLRRSNVMHRHPKYDWLIANIDRKVQGEKVVEEIKTVSHRLAHLWGPEGTDEIAEYYLPQPNHYMLVLDYPRAEVAAMIGMDDLRIYQLERDQEMDELIIETTHDFWHDHVLKGIPPEIDPDHKAAADVLKRLYRQVDGEEITLPDEAAAWHEVRTQALEQAKAYQAVADNAKHHIEALMGNAAKARIPGIDGAYVRENRHRDGYTVDPTDYVQLRYSKRFK